MDVNGEGGSFSRGGTLDPFLQPHIKAEDSKTQMQLDPPATPGCRIQVCVCVEGGLRSIDLVAIKRSQRPWLVRIQSCWKNKAILPPHGGKTATPAAGRSNLL